MELDTNNHSVFCLIIIFNYVKYRNNVINDAISLRQKIFKIYALIIIFRWKNGITIKTMFMYCSEDSLIVRFLNLSMLINQQGQTYKKRISRNQETFMEGYVLVTKLLFDIYRWGDRRYH